MPGNIGDYAPSTVVYDKFVTTSASTGAPTPLAGTPALSVYKDNSTTQSTTGVTLTVDFDGVTGLNHWTVDTSADGTFYAAGSNFQVVITTGTVGGTSAVGYVVGSFSLNKTSALRPTTAGRTLDVSAGGEAGVDWANVGSPTTTVNLSGTSVKTATDVETDTADIQTRLPAALVSGRMDASVGAYQTGLTPLQPTVAGRTLDVSATGEAGIDWANVGSPTTVNDLSGTTISTGQVVASVTGNVGGNVVGSVGSVATAGIDAASFAAGAIDAAALATDAKQAIADTNWGRDMSAISRPGGGVRYPLQAIDVLRNKVDTSVSPAVIYQDDDTTTSFTSTLTTDPAAEPVVTSDPS